MGRIKAILSDGGNILFNDTETKAGPYESIKPYVQGLTYEQFREGFRQYKTLAQTMPIMI
ncbi:MAG: hypothetical protein AABY09_01575 [Nanoarchaeota archaeon]